ncbi:MAG TPA: hypothetical protein VGB22_04195 [candidate division Zixibacteria bacterium]|jgi:lipoate-protein ligase A
MALDYELLETCRTERDTAFLRFYRMDPPAVTIGRNQQWQHVVSPHRCSEMGWEWARRPTGGGALLHRNEINYAIIAGPGSLGLAANAGFTATLLTILSRLQRMLIRAGIPAAIESGRADTMPPNGRQHGLCGRSLTGYEIGLDGGKLLAAAQFMSQDVVLQHGTVYLHAPVDDGIFWPDDSHGLRARTQRWTSMPLEFQDCGWQESADRLRACFHDTSESGHFAVESWLPPDSLWDRVRRRADTWQREHWDTFR